RPPPRSRPGSPAPWPRPTGERLDPARLPRYRWAPPAALAALERGSIRPEAGAADGRTAPRPARGETAVRQPLRWSWLLRTPEGTPRCAPPAPTRPRQWLPTRQMRSTPAWWGRPRSPRP